MGKTGMTGATSPGLEIPASLTEDMDPSSFTYSRQFGSKKQSKLRMKVPEIKARPK